MTESELCDTFYMCLELYDGVYDKPKYRNNNLLVYAVS